MKRTFKLLSLLFVISILSAGKTLAGELTKNFHDSWTVSSVSTLEISNKFGKIYINDNGGDSVTVDVVVTVEAADERRGNELLDKIEVNFRKSSGTASAVTKIENDFKSQKQFSIDYTVNIPADKNLRISNKYGNTVLNKLEANGSFTIAYGNFTANNLQAPADQKIILTLSYGNANIGSVNRLNAEISYSPVSIGEIQMLDLTSKYSVINVEESGEVIANSKYDKLNFEEIKSLTVNSKYSHIRIEELAKKLKMDAGYGGIKVAEIGNDFELIDISNSYGQVQLGLDVPGYSVDASCQYCGISFPEDSFEGNKTKDNNTQILKGIVGNGGSAKVIVKSRYGDIKLRD